MGYGSQQMVPVVQTFLAALPEILNLSFFGVAGFVTFLFSRQLQSRGLLRVSRGFLVKLTIDGAWSAYYYIVLGGPYGIIRSIESSPAQNIGETLALYYWVGVGTSLISLSLMIFFIIYGATKEVIDRQAQRGQTATLQT